MDEKRVCKSCNEEKLKNEFPKVNDKYYVTHCRPCHNKRSNDYRKKPTSNHHINWRERQYRKLYGIGIEEYNKLVQEQDGKCLICEESSGIGSHFRLAIDHCHVTKKIRGLLCTKCNAGLGGLRDSPILLRKALQYIEGFNQGLS